MKGHPGLPIVGHVRTRVYDRDPQPAREPLWLGPHVCIWRDRTSSASASLLTYTKPLLFDQIFTDGYIGFHAWSHRHRSRSPAYEAGWWNSLFSFSLAFALFFAYMGIDKRQTNALPHARWVGRFPPSCSPGLQMPAKTQAVHSLNSFLFLQLPPATALCVNI